MIINKITIIRNKIGNIINKIKLAISINSKGFLTINTMIKINYIIKNFKKKNLTVEYLVVKHNNLFNMLVKLNYIL